MRVLFLFLLFSLGACFGSFLCCQVRRLHRNTKKGNKKLGSRSVCLHCHKQLRWYDNLPIASWLLLRGKCRYCHQSIGLAEIFSELGLGLTWLAIGFTINPFSGDFLTWAIFLTTLLLTSLLVFLALYDGLYGQLPTQYLILTIIVAFILLLFKQILAISISSFSFDLILQSFGATLILGGLYLVLYLISQGRWVGDGDWLLGTALGLALSDIWLALITLFLANFLACLIMFPFIKKNRRQKIYFGPFLVTAFIFTTIFSDFLLSLIGK